MQHLPATPISRQALGGDVCPKLIGSATDRAGRTGTAVAITGNPSGVGLERRILIFDPDTSMLLAEETVLLEAVDWLDADPPIVIGYNTYLVSDICCRDSITSLTTSSSTQAQKPVRRRSFVADRHGQ